MMATVVSAQNLMCAMKEAQNDSHMNDILMCWALYSTCDVDQNNPCYWKKRSKKYTAELAICLKNCSAVSGSKMFGTAVALANVIFACKNLKRFVCDSDDLAVIISQTMMFAVLLHNAQLTAALQHVNDNINFYLEEFGVDEPEHTRWDQFYTTWQSLRHHFLPDKVVDAKTMGQKKGDKISRSWTYSTHIVTQDRTFAITQSKKVPTAYLSMFDTINATYKDT